MFATPAAVCTDRALAVSTSTRTSQGDPNGPLAHKPHSHHYTTQRPLQQLACGGVCVCVYVWKGTCQQTLQGHCLKSKAFLID